MAFDEMEFEDATAIAAMQAALGAVKGPLTDKERETLATEAYQMARAMAVARRAFQKTQKKFGTYSDVGTAEMDNETLAKSKNPEMTRDSGS